MARLSSVFSSGNLQDDNNEELPDDDISLNMENYMLPVVEVKEEVIEVLEPVPDGSFPEDESKPETNPPAENISEI